MTCPVCASPLAPTLLLDGDGERPDLRGFRCPEGHGAFLPSDLYFGWREAGTISASELSVDELATATGDLKQAKLCPQDARIMSRFQVTQDTFWLDRCATCGGVWFDGNEWAACVDAGLHEQLPRIFSDAWQRERDAEAQQRYFDQRLRETVGDEALDRTDAFREWLAAQPHRDLLTARLLAPEASA